MSLLKSLTSISSVSKSSNNNLNKINSNILSYGNNTIYSINSITDNDSDFQYIWVQNPGHHANNNNN